jgi:hypothetical protein
MPRMVFHFFYEFLKISRQNLPKKKTVDTIEKTRYNYKLQKLSEISINLMRNIVRIGFL